MTFPYGSNVPSSSVPRPIPGDSSQKAPPSKGALQGRVITQNPSFGQLVARVALGFFVVMTAPISIPIIHCVMTALTRANLNKEGSHFERICMKIHNLMGFGPPVKEVWRELGDVVLRSYPGSKDSFNKAFEAAIEFSSNSTKENFENLRQKLAALPDNVKKIISDNKILITDLIGSECVGRCSERALVALDEALDTSSIAKFMNSNGFVAIADFSDSGIEGERALEVSYNDRVALKEVFNTLCVIGGTNDPGVRGGFRDELIEALGKLPEKVKEYLFKGNGLNRFFEQYFQDIKRLEGKPLEGEALCLERALYPKDMVIFLKKLLDGPERESKIEKLKSYAERVYDNQVDSPIPAVAREDLESLLGFKLPADLTPRRLLNSLDYVKYAIKDVQQKVQKAILEMPKADWDQTYRDIDVLLKSSGVEGDYPRLEIRTTNLIQGDADSHEMYQACLQDSFVQDSGRRFPTEIKSVRFDFLDGEKDEEAIKAEVKKMVEEMPSIPKGKRREIEMAVLHCCSQFSFQLMTDNFQLQYISYIQEKKESLKSQIETLQAELDNGSTHIDLRLLEATKLELEALVRQTKVPFYGINSGDVKRIRRIAPLEGRPGFKVEMEEIWFHEVPLPEVGIDGIIPKEEVRRAAADLGRLPKAQTVVSGSFEVLIDPDKIGDSVEFQEAFQLVNSQVTHKTIMLR